MAEAWMDPGNRRAALEEQVKAQAAEFVKTQPPEVQAAIASQHELQERRDALEIEYRAELEALTRKYEAAYAPIYSQRRDLLAKQKIPKFWAIALANLPTVDGLSITDKDLEVLLHVTDVTSELLPASKGFSVTFHFGDNEFLSNKTLTNTFYVHDMDGDNPELEKAVGSKIDWKQGKNVTVKVMKKKPKGPGQKVLTKTEDCDSFFHFFSPPEMPADVEDMDEEELEDLEDRLEATYMLGSAIRTHLIPKALQWYTGEALATYGDDFLTDDDDEGESDDMDEEDDIEGATDEDSSSGAEGGGPTPGTGAPVDPNDPNAKPECKQQ